MLDSTSKFAPPTCIKEAAEGNEEKSWATSYIHVHLHAAGTGYGHESWILDTGASHHMSSDFKLFVKYTRIAGQALVVYTANSS